MWHPYGTTTEYRLPANGAVNASPYLAGFDLYDTLIQSENGSSTPSRSDNWIWTRDVVPEMLKELYKQGWMPVIFSNLRGTGSLDVNKAHVEGMIQELGFEPLAFFSTKKDGFAKPNRGMFDMFQQLTQVQPNAASFFVGNSEGKEALDPAYRMSDADSGFARSAGLSFYNPSEFFANNPEPGPQPGTNGRELIIEMGQQGSGKSTFAKLFSDKYGYTIVERHGAKQNYLKDIQRDFLEKQSRGVIFDATNPSRENRREAIEWARQYGILVSIFWFSRKGGPYNALRPKPVPAIALNKYGDSFEYPSVDEGEYTIEENGVKRVAHPVQRVVRVN